jgi:AraC family transcriptional regulator, regulatory protein of adaptative response / methylated-DNA-[protein]-cysteine methyltransferase
MSTATAVSNNNSQPPTPNSQDLHPTPNSQEMWDAVLARDATADRAFVYGVRSTGVYCRPSCPSRRPNRESVAFFSSADVAEIAGYRECRRCRPRQGVVVPTGLSEVRAACAFIAAHADETLTLAQVAEHVGASPFHFQRTFTRIVGISPRAYQDALRARTFRGALRNGTDLSAAVYDAGYGSISRVYEHSPTGRGMTPAVHRRGGQGEDVRYTIVASPLGRLLLAGTAKGVCAVMLGDRDDRLEAQLRAEYAQAQVTRDEAGFAQWAERVLAHLDGRQPHLDLPIDVRGTAFQWKVWRYLQQIPYGETRSYSDVARAIGAPAAVRAVARACATNKVCLVIPCHRVVGKDGSLSGYRWGVERKSALLKKEAK